MKTINNYLIHILYILFVCFFYGCVSVPRNDKRFSEPKPLLSDAELFSENSAEYDAIDVACSNVLIAFGNAQKKVLSTGQSVCVILENKDDVSTISICELKKRSAPPELGEIYEVLQLPQLAKFTDNKRYFYINSTRRIDFDEDDIRLISRKKNPQADIIIISKNSSYRRKGLIDLNKNNAHLRLYFTEE